MNSLIPLSYELNSTTTVLLQRWIYPPRLIWHLTKKPEPNHTNNNKNIIIILFFVGFSHKFKLVVFHWRLSDWKFSQVSRTLLSIQADFKNAVVWMLSILPLIFNPANLFSKPLGTIPSVLIIIVIMFHNFFNSLIRSRHLSIFLLSFIFPDGTKIALVLNNLQRLISYLTKKPNPQTITGFRHHKCSWRKGCWRKWKRWSSSYQKREDRLVVTKKIPLIFISNVISFKTIKDIDIMEWFYYVDEGCLGHL